MTVDGLIVLLFFFCHLAKSDPLTRLASHLSGSYAHAQAEKPSSPEAAVHTSTTKDLQTAEGAEAPREEPPRP